MSGHGHDEPENWVGPESLDPTPVWKQGVLVGILLLVSLIVIALVAIPALLPQMVTPPASVPGGRVVLSLGAMPAPNGQPLHVGRDVVDEAHTFYIAQPVRGELVAVRTRWRGAEAGGALTCEVKPLAATTAPMWRYVATCPGIQTFAAITFGLRGEPLTASRSLERYLVSVEGDRVVVNISRVIASYGATPQPRVSPLSTP